MISGFGVNLNSCFFLPPLLIDITLSYFVSLCRCLTFFLENGIVISLPSLPPGFFQVHFYPHAACVTPLSSADLISTLTQKNGSLKFLLTTSPTPQNLSKSKPSIALSQAKFSTLNLNSILFCLLGSLLNHPFFPVSLYLFPNPIKFIPEESAPQNCVASPVTLAFLLQ